MSSTDPSTPDRPSWQLPPGVSRGTWNYVTTSTIATEYDGFHDGHPLLELDRQLIARIAESIESTSQSTRPHVALDLGCGTGRSLLPLADRGWRCLGVDLSSAMLQETRAKALSHQVDDRMATLRANMVQLQFLKDRSLDLALCMYSSIGMVRERKNRIDVMRQVSRALHPHGRFLVHVHNRGSWLRDPQGIRLTLHGWYQSLKGHWELGDRIYAYRGLPSMFLHIYSHRELRSDLREAKLEVVEWIPLNRQSSQPLTLPHCFPHWRAGGFIAICQPLTR